MKRSLETAVFLTYDNTYARMGTIVKSWIKNYNTICLENLEINKNYCNREFWFMYACLPMGQRNTFEVEGQIELSLANLPWNMREEHAWSVVRNEWAYLCFVIEGFYKSEADVPYSIDLTNFPTDIVSEVLQIVEKIVTKDTVSVLENDFARSAAEVSDGLLSHSLETKPIKQHIEKELTAYI